jgi:hypothetical protein
MLWKLRDDLILLAYTLFIVFAGFLLGCTFILAVVKQAEQTQEEYSCTCE